MKNLNNHGQSQHGPALDVSVTVDEAPLLKNLVEKLAHRRCDTGYCHETMPEGWKSIETSSIEAYISGCMDIHGLGEHIAMSYTTCFAFTCTRVCGGVNTLSWVNSLS